MTIFGLGVTFVEKEFRLLQGFLPQHKLGQKKQVRVSQDNSLIKKTYLGAEAAKKRMKKNRKSWQ